MRRRTYQTFRAVPVVPMPLTSLPTPPTTEPRSRSEKGAGESSFRRVTDSVGSRFDPPRALAGSTGGGEGFDDASLASWIETDGRSRLAHRLPVSLDLYLDAVPSLPAYPTALDAALEVVLEWMAFDDGVPQPQKRHADVLASKHPTLSSSIYSSFELARFLWSTRSRRRAAEAERPLPCDAGPPLAIESGMGVSPTPVRRYQLLERLGAGSSGTVYRALDRQFSGPEREVVVALKIFHAGVGRAGGGRAGHASDVLDEARRARWIDSPYVVRVLDCGVSVSSTGAASEEAEHYIAYELAGEGSGGKPVTLDVHARHALAALRGGVGGDDAAVSGSDRRAAMAEAARLIAMAARGVDAAHQRRVIHRDLKPHNILVDAPTPDHPSPRVRVTDFGAATLDHGERHAGYASAGGAAPSAPGAGAGAGGVGGEPIGNLAFIAPEQYRSDPGGGGALPAADVYALGGMLYFLLTGDLPNGSTVGAIHAAHTAPTDGVPSHPPITPVHPRGYPGWIDSDLRALCETALARRPSDRYASAMDLAVDLESFASCRPLPVLGRTRRTSAARRFALAWRRAPARVLSVVGATMTLTALLVYSGYAYRAARDADDRLRYARESVQRQIDLFSNNDPPNAPGARPEVGGAPTVPHGVDESMNTLSPSLTAPPPSRARPPRGE